MEWADRGPPVPPRQGQAVTKTCKTKVCVCVAPRYVRPSRIGLPEDSSHSSHHSPGPSTTPSRRPSSSLSSRADPKRLQVERRGVSAVHGQRRAGDVSCGARAEEGHRTGDVLAVTHPAKTEAVRLTQKRSRKDADKRRPRRLVTCRAGCGGRGSRARSHPCMPSHSPLRCAQAAPHSHESRGEPARGS